MMSRVTSKRHDSGLSDYGMNPVTAQYILFTSLQKLDQAKRSRGGIRLRHGLMIAVTALKAKQLLWGQSQPIHENEYTSKDTLETRLHTEDYGSVHMECDVYDQPIVNQEFNDFSYLHDPSGPFFPPPVDDMMEIDNTGMIDCPSKRSRLEYAFPSTPVLPSYNESYLVSIK
ncbi:unnamed protein product [Heterobilharzia americana]|nr:unnamed protein product [Heterobilharzia americana]CAH8435899.1 unnamed protein product [Heterobilharzia americana]